jgi:hypothetical protein
MVGILAALAIYCHFHHAELTVMCNVYCLSVPVERNLLYVER